jgi:hypothetical protein
MKLLITIFLFFMFLAPANAISLEQANEYSSLVLNLVNRTTTPKFRNFTNQDLFWLQQAEKAFYDLGKTKDEMLMAVGFDQSGVISKLSVIEISPNLSLDDFKKTLASIAQLKLPATSIPNLDNYYFEYYSYWGYLDYGQEAEISLRPATRETSIDNQNLSAIERALKSQMEFKASLSKPDFLEYPYIGQHVEFYLPFMEPTKISGYIEDLDNSSIKIRFSEISRASERLIVDINVLLDQTNKDFCVLGAKILGTALSSVSSAGFWGSALTNGILPGAYAVLASASVLADEHQKTRSYSLSKGDEVLLIKTEEKK